MLKFLRKKTKVVIWTVMIAFIAWGGFAVSLQFEETNRSPGRIFGKEVSFRDHLLAYRAVQIFFVQPNPEEPPKSEEIEARTWEFLILSREAKHRKIKVSDEEIRQEIRRLFTQGGASAFSSDQYLQWVRSAFREEPSDFENQLREHLRIRKLLSQVREKEAENSDDGLRRWLTQLVVRARPEVYPPPT